MKQLNIISLAFLTLFSSITLAQPPSSQVKPSPTVMLSLSATEQEDDNSDQGDVIYHQCYLNPVSCIGIYNS